MITAPIIEILKIELSESLHDDLDSFFFKLQHEPFSHNVITFCIPKLSDEELKLFERNDELHLNNYFWHFLGRNPDVSEAEMAKSESKSKYAFCSCWRFTYSLSLDSDTATKRRRITLDQ